MAYWNIGLLAEETTLKFLLNLKRSRWFEVTMDPEGEAFVETEDPIILDDEEEHMKEFIKRQQQQMQPPSGMNYVFYGN